MQAKILLLCNQKEILEFKYLPIKRIIKKLNYPKKELIDLVLDINNYILFLPWCKKSTIINTKETTSKKIIIADLEIGYKLISDIYRSKIIFDKKKSEIKVTPLSGPIKKLLNIWKFKTLSNKSCEIDFLIEIELSNILLNKLFESFFEIGFEKIFKSFEDRAKKIII